MYNSRKWQADLPAESVKPVVATRRKRQFTPFFFRMGPVALSVCSVLLIGLMAVLYLSQLGQAVAANQKIHTLRNEQAQLERQKQDLSAIIAQEQSPAFIIQQATKMGLVPVDPREVHVIQVSRLQPVNQP